jgi:hypothetical protein
LIRRKGMFYTYLWLRENGIPYYVGKGSVNRAHVKGNHRLHPPPKNRIVIQEFESEEDAFFAERFLIAAYGREDLSEGCLLNLTDGGENPPIRDKGSYFTQAAKQKGRKLTAEWKAAISRGHLGVKPTEETRRKLVLSHLGYKPTIEHLANLSASLKGRRSPMKGRKHSEEARKAISKANAGRKWSEQSRVNFRDIAIERERKKRVQNDKQLF